MRTVSMTVRLLPGIEAVEADFKSRSARIQYDASLVTVEEIQRALENIGYEALAREE